MSCAKKNNYIYIRNYYKKSALIFIFGKQNQVYLHIRAHPSENSSQ